MSEINLDERFPDMRPVSSPPTLFTLNGVGTGLYGSRDLDPETQTYVKTLCICVLFIPLIPLAAYRIANAPRGWYFLGKVPLSPVARYWNYALLLLLVAGGTLGAWGWYTNTPEYVARHTLEEADQLASRGQLRAAAEKYQQVIRRYPQRAPEAAEHLGDLLAGPLLDAPATEAVPSLRVAAQPPYPVPAAQVYDRGMAWVERQADGDVPGVLQVLDLVTPLAPDQELAAARSQRLLERLNTQTPNNPDLASHLAVLYETQHQRERCEALLMPLRTQLGGREGARILGQLLADKGDVEQAEPLLLAYCEEGLEQLHAAEKRQEEALASIQIEVIAELKHQNAAGFNYHAYDLAPREEKARLLNDYLLKRFREDPRTQSEQATLVREGRVVPVALDLGIVLLHRAQGLPEPQRQEKLEKAEKVFLAIRGQAGETDQYRLQLGQVYFWMGKDAKGQELFDELLKVRNRDVPGLLEVSTALRGIGNVAQARTLAEEAYGKAPDPEQKHGAARTRALLARDLEDRIDWLRKSEPSDPDGKAEFAATLGKKAYQDGNEEEAARQARAALTLYGSLPPNASTLNNSALTHFLLYEIAGDRAELDAGIDNLQKALALEPSNSILLGNVASSVLEVALRDVIHTGIDMRALRLTGDLNLLSYLYNDDAGREKYRQQVREHPGIKRALGFYERLLVLAPKNAHARQALLALYRYTRDTDALRRLARDLTGVELDLSDHTREMREMFAGANDNKYRTLLQSSTTRLEAQVQALRPKKDRTFAVAATHLVSNRLGLHQFGENVDADGLVALAQEAYEAAPSRATRSTLSMALFHRAGTTLAKEQPEYGALAKRLRHSLNASYLIAFLLSNDGPLGDAAARNADVQRALTLAGEQGKQFPSDTDGYSWALSRRGKQSEADRVAAQLRTDETSRLGEELSARLNPLSPVEDLEQYWRLKALGKDTEAQAHLKRCAADGVPLPVEGKP